MALCTAELTEELAKALEAVEHGSRNLRPAPAHLEGVGAVSTSGGALGAKRVESTTTAAEDAAASALFAAKSADAYYKELAASRDIVLGDAADEPRSGRPPAQDDDGLLVIRGGTHSASLAAHQQKLKRWAAMVNYWIREGHDVTQDITTLNKKLGSLIEINTAVKQQSTFLSSQASALITRSETAQKLCNSIEERLKHFATVDRLSNELSSASLDPRSGRFRALLSDMDATMAFLSKNSHFKSATQYLNRMHVTQQKALVILRDHLTTAFQQVAASVAKDPRFAAVLKRAQARAPPNATSSVWSFARTAAQRIGGSSESLTSLAANPNPPPTPQGAKNAPSDDTAADAEALTLPPGSFGLGSVLSIEFRGKLHDTVPLIASLESRCKAEAAQVFLQDALDAYCQARLGLLAPLFADYMAAYMKEPLQGADLANIISHATTYLLEMATDESDLFRRIWLGGKEGAPSLLNESQNLDGMLNVSAITAPSPPRGSPKGAANGDAGGPLAQALRGIIDSCSLVLYDSFRTAVVQEDDMMTLCGLIVSINNSVYPRLSTAGDAGQLLRYTVQKMCQDAQERLIFRASMFVKDVIAPAGHSQTECLLYTQHEHLKRAGVQAGGKIDLPTQAAAGGKRPTGKFFPALEDTLNLLSSLYSVVDKQVFCALAQEAVYACGQNLAAAARTIALTPAAMLPGADLDAKLFLVMHLLRLREQITPFEVSFQTVEKYVDLRNIQQFRFNEISVAATQHDTKKEVEVQLKQGCEQFIAAASQYVGAPFKKYTKILKQRSSDPLAPAAVVDAAALAGNMTLLPPARRGSGGGAPPPPTPPQQALRPEAPAPAPTQQTSPKAAMAPAGMAPAPADDASGAVVSMAPAGMAPAADGGASAAVSMAPVSMAPTPTPAPAPAPTPTPADPNGPQGKGEKQLHQTMRELKSIIERFETMMPALLTKMKFYLSNQFALGILLKPVRDNVLEAYNETHKMLGIYVHAVANAAGMPHAANEFMEQAWGPAKMTDYLKTLIANHQGE